MKTTIEMAGKAFETPGVEPAFRNGFWTVTSEELEAFAELVRADERDRATRENAYVLAEREACAEMAKEYMLECEGAHFGIGAAIRARGQA